MFGRDSWHEWTLYTPTFAAGTGVIGDGSTAGMWRRVGDSIEYLVTAVIGSTTTFQSGQTITLSLPSGMVRAAGKILSNTGRVYSGAYFIDASAHANDRAGLSLVGNGASVATGISESSTGNSITNVTPFTWANGDRLILWGTVPIEGF